MIPNPSRCLSSSLFLIGLGWLLSFAIAANGQEILPFPPTPSASTAGLTMQDSTYKKRVEPKRLAADAPNILIILMDDVGPGASHGPHQVWKEWADKYKGKFDDGWDKYRERAFARQKQLGWIPQNAQLTPRPASMQAGKKKK